MTVPVGVLARRLVGFTGCAAPGRGLTTRLLRAARGALARLGSLVVRSPALVLIVFFRLWQLLASPTYGQACRFYPSCSAYGVDAVRTHGALRGGLLTVRRIGRCHPWNPGGYDPVPSTGSAVARCRS